MGVIVGTWSVSFSIPPLIYPSSCAAAGALKLQTHSGCRLQCHQFPARSQFGWWSVRTPRNCQSIGGGGDSELREGTVEELRIPDHWLLPTKALEESEWLRGALRKWLDEEYCPEPMNVEISKIAARSYHTSLLQRTTHVTDILLNMITELQSISYQESFHGAFSSANAAVSLITERIHHQKDD